MRTRSPKRKKGFSVIIATDGNARGVTEDAPPPVVLSRIVQDIERLDGLSIVLGIDGSVQVRDTDVNMATLALMHEFGTKNMPARPFLTNLLAKHGEKYAEIFLRYVVKNLRGANLGAARIAKEMRKDLEAYLTDRSNGLARNAPATIEKKAKKAGRQYPPDLPLIDTAAMMRATKVTWFNEKTNNVRAYASVRDMERALEALANKT